MKIDLHMHSNLSCDSKASIDSMCQAAIAKNFDQICFTEHYDLNPLDSGKDYLDFDRYSEEIDRAQDKYSGKLEILKGIEFSEPHSYPRQFNSLQERNFDFILGSVHWFSNAWVADKHFQANHTIEQIFQMYYSEVLKAVRFGGFDSLAHVDFPKRYLARSFEPREIVSQVLDEIVKKNICLELNSSPIRKGKSEPYPSDSICGMYHQRGGRNVTIGSDAHSDDEIGKDFATLCALVEKYEFTIVAFRNRTAITQVAWAPSL